MHSSIVISVLLGAGAIAHPHFKLNNPLAHVHHKRDQPAEVHQIEQDGHVVIEEVYVETITGPAPAASSTAAVYAPQKLQVAPANNAPQQQQPSITPTVTPAPTSAPAPAKTSAAPAASSPPSTGGSDGAPLSNGKSILESANKYRALMGFPKFTYSKKLENNALKTNTDDGANSMTHELNDGSMAQCLAEVDNLTGADGYTSFEYTYLGWLCEIDDGRLGNDCNAMEKATNMIVDKSDPGHAEILRNPSYTQIGCNYLTSTQHHDNYAGIYACDFA